MKRTATTLAAPVLVTGLAFVDFPFHGYIGPMPEGSGEHWTKAMLRGIVSNVKLPFEDLMEPSFCNTIG